MPRPDLDLQTIRRKVEPGRLLLGSVLEMLIKAYGAGAALSVALSDAEKTSGKAGDAIRAAASSGAAICRIVLMAIPRSRGKRQHLYGRQHLNCPLAKNF